MKKRSKKLLCRWLPPDDAGCSHPKDAKVFWFFFSKKNRFLLRGPGTLRARLVFPPSQRPLIAPYKPTTIELHERLLPPAWEATGSSRHLLGTDNIGRDLFSRIVWGARISLSVGIAAAGLGAVIGGTLGLCAGYFGGVADTVISWLIEVQLAFPFTLFAIFLLAVFGGGFLPVVSVLALATWVNYARVVRGQAMSLRSQDFILAAQSVGRRPRPAVAALSVACRAAQHRCVWAAFRQHRRY